jgi:DNA-binding MarR family transcriptional regulator
MSKARQEENTDRIADALHSAAIRLLRMVRKEDVAAGVSGPQLSALSVLAYGGPQKLGALAAAEQVSLPTISRLVTELERRGLAERAGDPADRRASIIRVTDAGRAVLRKGRELRLAKLVRALDRLGRDDQRLLGQAAQLILALNEPA